MVYKRLICLGVNILPRNKTEIIKTVKELNSNIKIYQMATDIVAFKLNSVYKYGKYKFSKCKDSKER